MDALQRLYNRVGSDAIIVSAPGRLDFLNTHQDYKGLPVVSIAINLRLYIAATKNASRDVCFESLDLKRKICVSPEDSTRISGHDFSDYLKAGIILAVKEWKMKPIESYSFVISSDVPIGAGLGSSGALLVAFMKLLSVLKNKEFSPQEIAEFAFRAENEILGIPCGRLDQYASAIGEIILINTKPPVTYKKLRFPKELGILAVDSGIKHRTKDVHTERQRELREALKLLLSQDLPTDIKKLLSTEIDAVAWEKISEAKIRKYLDALPEKLAKRIIFTLRMNDLTKIAVRVLNGEHLSKCDKERLYELGIKYSDNLELLCRIIDKQHDLLRDYYDVSLPEIERIIEAARVDKYSCAKLSGAGLGGAIIVLSKGNLDIIKKRVLDAGASRAWIVRVDTGVRVES